MSTSWNVRVSIYTRDDWRCVYCERALAYVEATLDHVVPRAAGGRHRASNLVTACKPCNLRKADRPVADLGWEAKALAAMARPFRLVHGPAPAPEPAAPRRGRVGGPHRVSVPVSGALLDAMRRGAAEDYAAYIRRVKVEHDLR